MQNERTVNLLVHLLIIVQWQSVKKLNQTIKCGSQKTWKLISNNKNVSVY